MLIEIFLVCISVGSILLAAIAWHKFIVLEIKFHLELEKTNLITKQILESTNNKLELLHMEINTLKIIHRPITEQAPNTSVGGVLPTVKLSPLSDVMNKSEKKTFLTDEDQELIKKELAEIKPFEIGEID